MCKSARPPAPWGELAPGLVFRQREVTIQF